MASEDRQPLIPLQNDFRSSEEERSNMEQVSPTVHSTFLPSNPSSIPNQPNMYPTFASNFSIPAHNVSPTPVNMGIPASAGPPSGPVQGFVAAGAPIYPGMAVQGIPYSGGMPYVGGPPPQYAPSMPYAMGPSYAMGHYPASFPPVNMIPQVIYRFCGCLVVVSDAEMIANLKVLNITILCFALLFGIAFGLPLAPFFCLLAMLPAYALLHHFYWRVSRHIVPVGKVIETFTLGLLSVVPALIFELVALIIITVLFFGGDARGLDDDDFSESDIYDRIPTHSVWLFRFANAYVVAAFVEEMLKYGIAARQCLPVMKPTVILLLSGTAALGFATMENIFYVIAERSIVSGFVHVLLRDIIAIPLHSALGVLIGYGLVQKYYQSAFASHALSSGSSSSSSRTLSVASTVAQKHIMAKTVACNVLLHGTYDFVLLAPVHPGVGYALAFVMFVVTLWLARRAIIECRTLDSSIDATGRSSIELQSTQQSTPVVSAQV
eukprot:GILJ01007387.1.p1 GENE.GILJ01007387.1~~GILJ01007387.1.p1  ORF type:complete len:500 (+),score=49.61 GILJ01007387.1:22-1500(+)